MNDLQNQESFSFSTSSKTGLFSDDEDGGVEDDHRTRSRISDHHQKDYLEISLPPPPPSTLITKTNQNDEKEEEFEFCFSFNSSSTLRDFTTTPIATSNHPFHNRETPMSTSTCATSQVIDAHKKYKHHNKSNNPIHYKHVFQRVSSPRCHQGLLSPYVFRTPIDGRGANRSQRFKKNLPKLECGNSARLGGIRKFMVKLRSIKSMLGSSLNLSRRLQPSPIDKLDKKTKKTFTDHKLNKIDLQRNRGLLTIKNDDSNNFVTNTNSLNRSKEEEKSFRMVRFDGFGKMMDVVMKNIRVKSSKQMGSKSCPVSIKSSPMHDIGVGNTRDERRNSFYSRDHSIQAAIAHCKKSFGK